MFTADEHGGPEVFLFIYFIALTYRCVLLTNMVGPHEVDDMLEAETKQECSKVVLYS